MRRPSRRPLPRRPSGRPGWDDLARVAAPVTLIRGDRGYVSEADAEEFGRRLPHASVTTLAAGHNVQEYAPAELGALIRDAAARHGKHACILRRLP